MILRIASASAMWAGASADDAQDIAQGILVDLCTASARHGKLPDRPRAWARVAAKRQAWALARRQSREMLISPDSLALSVVADYYDIAEGIAEHEQLLGWISRLPEEQRAVIALSMDGFPVTDIAHHLKIPPSLARARLRAAHETLRTAFVDQLEEDRQVETARQGEFARRRGPASWPHAADPPPREDTDLAALPPRQQEVLRLSRRGYKPAQIAHALAISPNTVRVNLFHARKRMRQRTGAAWDAVGHLKLFGCSGMKPRRPAGKDPAGRLASHQPAEGPYPGV